MTLNVIHYSERWLCPDVQYVFKCTHLGRPEQGPSYTSGGEPAEGPEFEMDDCLVCWADEHDQQYFSKADEPVQSYLEEQFFNYDVFDLCVEALTEDNY